MLSMLPVWLWLGPFLVLLQSIIYIMHFWCCGWRNEPYDTGNAVGMWLKVFFFRSESPEDSTDLTLQYILIPAHQVGEGDGGRTRTEWCLRLPYLGICVKVVSWIEYTLSQKNDNDVPRYNFNAHQPILIIFGRDIAEWICYWMVISYPTSHN